jgi:hypothetical protein
MTAQQNHSPINFTLDKGVYADQVYLKDALGKIVCDFANRENGKANSAFILLACNSYYEDKRTIEELLQGCKDATYWLDFYDADLPHNKSLAVLKNILTIAISKVGKGE